MNKFLYRRGLDRVKGFTMIEILITLGILAFLGTVVILLLNPVQLIAQSRDAQRVSDLKRIDSAVQLNKNAFEETLTDNTLASIVYTSLPDINSNPGDNCGTNGEYSLPALISGWQYRCVASSTNLRKIDGTGWIPIVFTSVSTNPLPSLPVDPVNTVAGGYYAYTQSGLATTLQSNKYVGDVASSDGGNGPTHFETKPITWLSGLPLQTGLRISSSTFNAGWNTPGVIVNDSSIGTAAWTNPGNAVGSDDLYAVASVVSSEGSHYLKGTNYGFNIPTNAVIDGVYYQYEGYSMVNNDSERDRIVKNNVPIGSSGYLTLTTTDSTQTGQASIYNGLTPSDINSFTFGSVIYIDIDFAQTTYIDQFPKLKVMYTIPPGGVEDDPSIGAAAWSNPYYAGVSDGWSSIFSSTTQASHYLKSTNHGFSLPSDAVIDGIAIEAEGGKNSGIPISVYFRPVKNNLPTGNPIIKTFTYNGSTALFYTAGGPTELWGQTWTPADINSTGFGAALNVLSTDNNVWIDSLRINVYYHQ